MLIKSEEYYNEAEQKQYVRNYYGSSADKIEMLEDRPLVFEEAVEELTDTELIQAQLLLTQQEIKAKQAEHDEVLALLLLGQQGV